MPPAADQQAVAAKALMATGSMGSIAAMAVARQWASCGCGGLGDEAGSALPRATTRLG